MRQLTLILTILLLLPSQARSQTPPTTAPSPAEVQTLLDRYASAFNSDKIDISADNLDSLKPLLAPDFSAVFFTGRTLNNLEDLRTQWSELKRSLIGAGGKYTLKITPKPPTPMGDFFLVQAQADESISTDRNATFHYAPAWTIILRKNPSNDPANPLQIVRLHASIDPVQNELVHFVTSKVGWNAAFLGGALGLILGLLLSMIFRRTRR